MPASLPFRLLWICCVCIPVLSARPDPVSLTDTQGRTIQAEIVSVAANVATVRMANGRQYRIPMDNLDKPSQTRIQQWELGKIASHREPFKVSIQNYTENEKKRDTGSHIIETFDEGYEITVENATPWEIPALKVEWLILKEAARIAASSNKDVDLQVKKGVVELEPMGMRGVSTFKTGTLPMQENRLKPNWIYTGGGRKNAVDDMAGVWIRVKFEDLVVFEYARPSSLPKKVNWEQPKGDSFGGGKK